MGDQGRHAGPPRRPMASGTVPQRRILTQHRLVVPPRGATHHTSENTTTLKRKDRERHGNWQVRLFLRQWQGWRYSGYEEPAWRQRSESGGNGQYRPSRTPRIYDHHGTVHVLLCKRPQVPENPGET